jgi:hypothetical protein
VGSGEELTPTQIRSMLDPPVWRAVKDLWEMNWTIRKQGHGVRLYCPYSCRCTAPVPGTPRDSEHAAGRIVRAGRRCPGAEYT